MPPATPPIPGSATIAAFDFDGTLTYGDTLLPFLARVSPARLVLGLAICAPLVAGFSMRLCSRDLAKQLLCIAVLRGRAKADLLALASRWAPSIALRPRLMDRFRWHRDRGHHCVLVSASPDIYLQKVASHLGFADLICTSLETDERGRITGRFKGANCWGPEKLRRLQERYGPAGAYVLHAYGDSTGDKWLIDAADHAWYKGREIKP